MNDTGSTRRDWLRSTAAWGLSGAVVSVGGTRAQYADDESVLDVGSRTQLFCDDFLIESKDGVRHKLHQPQKANDGQPVLLLDQPWEEIGTPILGTVIRDRGNSPSSSSPLLKNALRNSPSRSTPTKRFSTACSATCRRPSNESPLAWTSQAPFVSRNRLPRTIAA